MSREADYDDLLEGPKELPADPTYLHLHMHRVSNGWLIFRDPADKIGERAWVARTVDQVAEVVHERLKEYLKAWAPKQ